MNHCPEKMGNVGCEEEQGHVGPHVNYGASVVWGALGGPMGRLLVSKALWRVLEAINKGSWTEGELNYLQNIVEEQPERTWGLEQSCRRGRIVNDEPRNPSLNLCPGIGASIPVSRETVKALDLNVSKLEDTSDPFAAKPTQMPFLAPEVKVSRR